MTRQELEIGLAGLIAQHLAETASTIRLDLLHDAAAECADNIERLNAESRRVTAGHVDPSRRTWAHEHQPGELE